MSVHTKTHRTKRVHVPTIKANPKAVSKEKPIPWREAFRDEINAYSEGTLTLTTVSFGCFFDMRG